MSGYESLPLPILRKLLSGMWLTHYRSTHPKGPQSLQVADGVLLEVDGRKVDIDIVIVNRTTRRIMAFSQVLAPQQRIGDVTTVLRHLRRYAESHKIELGVAVPASREREVVSHLGENVKTVTYPG